MGTYGIGFIFVTLLIIQAIPAEEPAVTKLIVFSHHGVSLPGDIVLDPFAGSGTTALAARSSGRRFVLVEWSWRECRP